MILTANIFSGVEIAIGIEIPNVFVGSVVRVCIGVKRKKNILSVQWERCMRILMIEQRLIDANKLVGADGLFSVRGCTGNCSYCDLWSPEGCRVVLEAPTVDAVPVMHGKWIIEEEESYRNVQCSVCGKDYVCHYGMLQLQMFGYCPNCGAKMDGD